jgi:hypothetical protein
MNGFCRSLRLRSPLALYTKLAESSIQFDA